MAMVFCRSCGKEIHERATNCPHCGAPQSGDADAKPKSRLVAALLAFFLGGLGIHRLYLGQWWGIFYFLFWWTGIPSVVSFVETIVFAVSSDASWNEKYGPGRARSMSGAVLAIIAVAMVFVGVAIIGILAAVSIPAYQAYTQKAKLAQVITLMHGAKQNVTQFIDENRRAPSSLAEAGFTTPMPAFVQQITIDPKDATIVVELGQPGFKDMGFEFKPKRHEDNHVTWTCIPTRLPPHLQSGMCKGQAE